MANYLVEPSILEEFLPKGTTLDFWNGECYVSLVAFKFFDTRVLGFKIPFHINFLEVNLRFYVKRETDGETRRGVVFIKEIVPRLAIALGCALRLRRALRNVANASGRERENEIVYLWLKGGRTNRVRVDFQKARIWAFPRKIRTANSYHRALLGLHAARRVPDGRIQGRASEMEFV